MQSACYDDLWFVHQPDRTLRIFTGPDGTEPWPAPTERAAAEAKARLAAEAELARLRGA